MSARFGRKQKRYLLDAIKYQEDALNFSAYLKFRIYDLVMENRMLKEQIEQLKAGTK